MVDVIESAGDLVARIDLPGVWMSDMEIEIMEDDLTVSGERRREAHRVDDNWDLVVSPVWRGSLGAGSCRTTSSTMAPAFREDGGIAVSSGP